MKSKNSKMHHTAMAFTEQVWRQCRVTLMVCGGFARDCFFDLEAKDVDLIVCDNDDYDESQVEWLLSQFRKVAFEMDPSYLWADLSDYDVEMEDDAELYADGDFAQRIAKVWHFNIRGTEIDIILNHEQLTIDSQETAVSYFDCNINQYALDEVGVPYFFGPTSEDPAVVGMTFFKEVSDKRKAHMLDKWEQIKHVIS